MDYIRKRVVEDADTRQALFERLLYALEGLQIRGPSHRRGETARVQPLRLDKRIPLEVEV